MTSDSKRQRRTNIKQLALDALAHRALASLGRERFVEDRPHYVRELNDNLVEGVHSWMFKEELMRGGGVSRSTFKEVRLPPWPSGQVFRAG